METAAEPTPATLGPPTPRSPAMSSVPLLALLPPLAQLTGDDLGLHATAHQHLRTLVDQVLRRQNLRPEVWAETVLTLVHRTCSTLRMDVRHGTWSLGTPPPSQCERTKGPCSV